ncbi:hypothetical protein TanjilG_01087 [Lupinus angustifolius]|uniref:Uncharacterized protein n=1 Tax=Lupinus angustifolius TaxID=3871 RepID=A0A1J7HSB2_LUPAN|nr:hypothetical protein TanjilG_01087 [Lupinus angustifolius]
MVLLMGHPIEEVSRKVDGGPPGTSIPERILSSFKLHNIKLNRRWIRFLTESLPLPVPSHECSSSPNTTPSSVPPLQPNLVVSITPQNRIHPPNPPGATVPNEAIKPETKRRVVSGLHRCCRRMTSATLAIDDALRRCR